MAALLIGFKQGDLVGLATPIQNYLSNNYQIEQPQKEYSADISAFELLRSDSLSLEPHEASLHALQRYYGQLLLLSKKFPFNETAIRIGWRWYTAFEKGRKKPVTTTFVSLELASTLFNIGAMFNQLGNSQFNRSNGELLKKSAFYFQSAAGAFQEIIDNYATELSKIVACSDLCSQTLLMLVQMNLALAQECFYYKAVLGMRSRHVLLIVIKDQMKDATIAKVASKAAEMFNTTYDTSQVEPTKGVVPHDWLVSMQTRALYLNGIAQYRKSREVAAAGKYGEEVGRLQASETLLKKAMDFKSIPPAFASDIKRFLETVQVQLKKSEKDNDIIYLEPVPSMNALVPIDKVQLSQKIAYPDPFALSSIIGKPLFGKLYPFVVHQQLSSYNERRRNIFTAQLDRLKQANEACNQLLMNFGLPGALQAYEQPIGLPSDLLKKSEEVRKMGGSQSLMEQIQTLQALSDENSKFLHEIETVLDEEAKEDEEGRKTFGDRWKRTSSTELQKGLREKLEKKKNTFAIAQKSDGVVKNKYELSIPHIAALSSTKEELEHSIPASSQVSAINKNDSSVVTLKEVLKEITEMKKAREVLIAKLKTDASLDDPSMQLMDVFNRGEVNFEPIIEKLLEKFQPMTKEVDTEIFEQQDVLKRLTFAYSVFQNARRENEGMKQRQVALQALENAYNDFKQLMENFQEGIKFHNEFSSVLIGMKNQISDLIAARSIEKKDLLKKISDAAANPISSTHLPPREPNFNQNPPSYQPAYQSQPNQNQSYGYAPSTVYQNQNNHASYYGGTWNPSVPISYGSPQQHPTAPGPFPQIPPQGYYQQPPSYPQRPPYDGRN